ncbi:DNA-3-methyladenine glycosylase 2 family protein [Rivibacter subsaxonicus]|uniref:DNA-3-methyladenine glycosylase II n=1 Tax=Rivibacter subsaxonicus TaxID=457575 RepID=A0A4V6MER6_9BURK|nr:Ada metal-binding domain-containing protein [Rivibacter subsaxonicus]RZU03046.1 DNA-3-methyladenine glycosylase II [Rivibacter subsaxonicus]
MDQPPTLDADTAWQALQARDARFDGRMFVGVTSTGIYCRPICRVRLPRRANCRFFDSAARAEHAGFRPCLRCRPELAPGLSLMDSSASLAQAAARMIDAAVQAGEAPAMPALAARLGVTDRHLRRIFVAEHGVNPVEYLTTRRLLLAKQLLSDTAQPITQVALASGFASLRRFNAAFVERYRLSPSRLRRNGAESLPAEPSALRIRLGFRPPFDAPALFGFLDRRAMAGVELVRDERYARSLRLRHGRQDLVGWLGVQVDAARCELVVDAAPVLAPALGLLSARLRDAFDLDADPALIDPVLARLPLASRPGLRLPGSLDGFEIAARVILGQQVTVKAARTLAQRLVERFGKPVATPWPEITRLFPSAAAIAAATPEAIGTLGIVRQRVRALQALAVALADGSLRLEHGAEARPVIEQLQALPGIGPWSAQLIAMRTLGWRDAWPSSDVGLWQALGSRDPKHIDALAEGWRPFRSHAVMRLWHELETAA